MNHLIIGFFSIFVKFKTAKKFRSNHTSRKLKKLKGIALTVFKATINKIKSLDDCRCILKGCTLNACRSQMILCSRCCTGSANLMSFYLEIRHSRGEMSKYSVIYCSMRHFHLFNKKVENRRKIDSLNSCYVIM